MNKLNLLIRICILLSPFIFPWWVILIFGLSALFLYDTYYEIIWIGLVCDILYHSENTIVGLYGFTMFACFLFIVIKQIKQRLIVY